MATRWRTALKEDYEVRALDQSGKWLKGKVVEQQGKKVRVHFNGWNSKYDEWCVRSRPPLAASHRLGVRVWPLLTSAPATNRACRYPMKSPKLKPMHQPGERGQPAKAAPSKGAPSDDGAAKTAKQPAAAMKIATTAKSKAQAKQKAKQKAKPKAKAAPKRKAAEMDDDDDDGEEHPTVRVVVGNTAKFLRDEDGKKFYEWTVFARAEPVYESSSDEESESEDAPEAIAAAAVKVESTVNADNEQPTPTAAAATLSTTAQTTDDRAAVEKPAGPPNGSHESKEESKKENMEESKDPEAIKRDAEKAERKKQRAEQRKAAEEIASNFIRKAEFTLHESFRPPVARFNQPPFEVTHEGWGVFVLPVLVETAGKRPLRVTHVLAFNKPESKKSYTLDSVTGKFWRSKKAVVVEPRTRPERMRVVAKPKALADFVDNNPESVKAARLERERIDEEEKRRKDQKMIERMEEQLEERNDSDEEAEEEEENEDEEEQQQEAEQAEDQAAPGNGGKVRKTTNTAKAAKASKPRKRQKREEPPEDYAAWKRQVRHKSDEAPVISPQWLQHFQQQAAAAPGTAAPAARARLRTSSSPRRAVSAFTRPSVAPIKGFNDLDALYYVWPKMHKAVSVALERLPPKDSSTTLRVARYFLIQYKRAQDSPDLPVRVSGGGDMRALSPGTGMQVTTHTDSSSERVAGDAGADGATQAVGAANDSLSEAYTPAGWSAHYPPAAGTAGAAAAAQASDSQMALEPVISTDAELDSDMAPAAPSGIAVAAQQLTADDADALDRSATSPAAAAGLQPGAAFSLKLENPESTLVRKDWTADEAEVVET